jgi:hypothetical protein
VNFVVLAKSSHELHDRKIPLLVFESVIHAELMSQTWVERPHAVGEEGRLPQAVWEGMLVSGFDVLVLHISAMGGSTSQLCLPPWWISF